jgi:hypothetical protein
MRSSGLVHDSINHQLLPVAGRASSASQNAVAAALPGTEP